MSSGTDDSAEATESEATVISIEVNGNDEVIRIEAGDTLMNALRTAGYYGVKNGCSEGVCGSCNVMYGEEQIVRSCLVPAEKYDGEHLTTALGLVADDGTLHPVQEEFLNYGAAQCGFCIPGMILTAVQFLDRNPNPTDDEVRSALRGNICRCTGYIQQVEAIQAAAERLQ